HRAGTLVPGRLVASLGAADRLACYRAGRPQAAASGHALAGLLARLLGRSQPSRLAALGSRIRTPPPSAHSSTSPRSGNARIRTGNPRCRRRGAGGTSYERRTTCRGTAPGGAASLGRAT